MDYVLDAIPEGWTATIIERELAAEHIAALNMKPGEVRRHRTS